MWPIHIGYPLNSRFEETQNISNITINCDETFSENIGRQSGKSIPTGTYIAIVSVQQSSGGVRCRVGHHVFAWVVERRQVSGVHLGVVRTGCLPADAAVQQFGLGVLLAVAPTAVDPQRLLAAGTQHAQLRKVSSDHWHCNDGIQTIIYLIITNMHTTV